MGKAFLALGIHILCSYNWGNNMYLVHISIRSITKLTSTTKTWPDYDKSMIYEPFYTVIILFWPLWPYPQAFESVVFMTQNRWYLQNSKVALFSCVVLYIEFTIFTLTRALTETSALSFSRVQLYCGWQKFCLLCFALRNTQF